MPSNHRSIDEFRPHPMRKRSISDSHLNLKSNFVRSISDVLDYKSRSKYPGIQERVKGEHEYEYEKDEDDLGRRWSGGSAESNSETSTPTSQRRKHGLLSFSLLKLVDATMALKRRPTDKTANPRQLILAIRNRDMSRIRYVLESCPIDVNACNSKGVSALHEAALDGQCDIIKILLQHNAQVNQEDNDGLTCLDYAVFGGHFECARYLIEAGATVNNVKDGMPTHLR